MPHPASSKPIRLFHKAVKYIFGQEDDEYAAKCRTAILVGIGLVKMPGPPNCQVMEISDDTSIGDVQQVA